MKGECVNALAGNAWWLEGLKTHLLVGLVQASWTGDGGGATRAGSGGTLAMSLSLKWGRSPIQPAPEELRGGGRRSEKEQKEKGGAEEERSEARTRRKEREERRREEQRRRSRSVEKEEAGAEARRKEKRRKEEGKKE